MIKIENRQVFSTENKTIHRVGSEVYFKRGSVLKTDTEADFEEVDEVPAYTKAEYDAKVAELIRERYSADEENALKSKMLEAILRPEEAVILEDGRPKALNQFDDFLAYRRECLERAKDAALYGSKEY